VRRSDEVEEAMSTFGSPATYILLTYLMEIPMNTFIKDFRFCISLQYASVAS
jgi:hypothetical protein